MAKNPAAILKRASEMQSTTLTINNPGNKEKRNTVDLKQKWTPEEFNRPEYAQKLDSDFNLALGEAMTKKLMSKDFNVHIKCIAQFKQLFESPDQQQNFLQILDLIIKWAFIKSFESSNTQFIKEIL